MAVDTQLSSPYYYGGPNYWDNLLSTVSPPAPLAPLPDVVTPTPSVDTTKEDKQAALAAARQKAIDQAHLTIRQRGLDPAQFEPLIQQELDNLGARYDENTDPKVAYSGDIASAVLDGEQARIRNQARGQVDSVFGADYGNKNIGSGLLDDTINSILSEQQGSAQQYLDRGKARGIYNDVGYNAGRSTLDAEASAGLAKLHSLGGDIINKYRSSANTVRDEAYGGASGLTLGSNFSLDPYINEGNDVIHQAQQNAGGDLRNALGGTKLFDFSSLNEGAGQAQGALNLRDADVATALAERRRNNYASRGLGSQGAF